MEFSGRASEGAARHGTVRPTANPGANNPNAEVVAVQRTFAGLLDAAVGDVDAVAPAGAGGPRSGRPTAAT